MTLYAPILLGSWTGMGALSYNSSPGVITVTVFKSGQQLASIRNAEGVGSMCANKSPTPEEFLEWAHKVESYQALNYSKKCRYRAEDVRRFLSSKGWLLPP